MFWEEITQNTQRIINLKLKLSVPPCPQGEANEALPPTLAKFSSADARTVVYTGYGMQRLGLAGFVFFCICLSLIYLFFFFIIPLLPFFLSFLFLEWVRGGGE